MYDCGGKRYPVRGIKRTKNSKIILDVYLNYMMNYKECRAHSYTPYRLLLLHIPEQYHHYIHIFDV